MTRFVFVVGGVMSGIGKGVTVAALARLFTNRGFSVSAVKIDPYVNVDAGTMNPTEHGEIFVTADGMECDQDIGTYERFLNTDLPGINSVTSGQIFQEVIRKERGLLYGGRCVEVVPDIPNEVIRRLKLAARRANADVLFVEIGGTAGEYQNILYLETARLMRLASPKHVAVVLVSYLPIPYALREMKTKPTQQAVHALQAAGLQPDFIVGRAAKPIDALRKRKLAIFCNVSEEKIISAPNLPSVYEVPLQFEAEGFAVQLSKKLHLVPKRPKTKEISQWRALVTRAKRSTRFVHIGIVGKYFSSGAFVLEDVYISVIEAIKHAAWAHGLSPKIQWLDAETYERSWHNAKELRGFDGIIVPGGFGERGTEGKIAAIRFARINRIPFLGLCFGMQLAVVEFSRNVAHMRAAHTTEINPSTPFPVIDCMPEQTALMQEKRLGGSMRLGNYACALTPKTLAWRAYAKDRRFSKQEPIVTERHRHRYEFNNKFQKRLEQEGLICSGINHERHLVEIVELPHHPFFVGTQFHPELASRPLQPHPFFMAFIAAAYKNASGKRSTVDGRK